MQALAGFPVAFHELFMCSDMSESRTAGFQLRLASAIARLVSLAVLLRMRHVTVHTRLCHAGAFTAAGSGACLPQLQG